MQARIFTVFFIAVLLFGCKKDEPVPVTDSGERDLYLHFGYESGTETLLFDTILYVNAAGNQYSVTRLEYFISGLILKSPEGDFKHDGVYYINGRDARYAVLGPIRVPGHAFNGISFHIGVDSVHNVSGGLPATIENNAMFWPVGMGGGYHFLKLEGHFRDSTGVSGYAVHLGKNKNLVNVGMPLPSVPESGTLRFDCTMDINEWFDNPYTFNLTTDGKYTMSSDALMKKIAGNGADVFSIALRP